MEKAEKWPGISIHSTLFRYQDARNKNKKSDALSKLASLTFAHLTKEVMFEMLQKKSIEAEIGMTPVEKLVKIGWPLWWNFSGTERCPGWSGGKENKNESSNVPAHLCNSVEKSIHGAAAMMPRPDTSR